PIGVLTFLERFEKLLAPVVFLTIGVGEFVFAQGIHRLGESVIVVVKPRVLLPRVLFQRVVSANPVKCSLDSRIVATDARIEKALQPRIGHSPLGAQSTNCCAPIALLIVGIRGVVGEAASIVLGGLGGEFLVLVLAVEVLTAADKGQGPLHGGIILGNA